MWTGPTASFETYTTENLMNLKCSIYKESCFSKATAIFYWHVAKKYLAIQSQQNDHKEEEDGP